MAPSDLVAGAVYSWEDLGEHFGFKPAYFSAAGGMPVSPSTGSFLLITHPGGGRAFDYKDYWDDDDLIYTGRGKVGDHERSGPNLDAAENRRNPLRLRGRRLATPEIPKQPSNGRGATGTCPG